MRPDLRAAATNGRAHEPQTPAPPAPDAATGVRRRTREPHLRGAGVATTALVVVALLGLALAVILAVSGHDPGTPTVSQPGQTVLTTVTTIGS